MGLRESMNTRLAAPPAVVFDVVTDVGRLPAWNQAITQVVGAPQDLAAGTEWKVRLKALGQSWVSRSQVVEIDAHAGRFVYRSQTDDGNPSYADWEWKVEPYNDGSTVELTVDLNPVTFWRKYLLVRIRRPALRREMKESLSALGRAVRA